MTAPDITAPRVMIAEGGASLSALAGGCWRLLGQSAGNVRRVEAYLQDCLELGITTFDHADIYGQHGVQQLFGAALKQRPGLREQIELVTKCGIATVSHAHPDHRVLHLNSSRSYILKAADDCLTALRTDYLDVLLIHRPDLIADCEEIAEAFVKLRDSQKVRNFGVSNYSISQLDLLQSKLPFRLIANQIEMSVIESTPLRDGTLDGLRLRNLAVMAWSPLAGGRLFSEPKLDPVRQVLRSIADKYGVDPITIAISWLLQVPAKILPVIGTIDRDRLTHVVKAVSVPLDRQDWYEIYASAGNTFA